MPHAMIEAGSLSELMDRLNGGVIGGKSVVVNGGKVKNLNGLTLVINTNTVTFSDTTGEGLPLIGVGSIKAAIEAVATGVAVKYYEGRLMLSHATGVTVAATGTANTVFGFSNSTAETGVVYNMPDGSVPRVLSIAAGARMDNYFAHLEVS